MLQSLHAKFYSFQDRETCQLLFAVQILIDRYRLSVKRTCLSAVAIPTLLNNWNDSR